MKAVIFAGGAGTRLWPLSRKKSPKQFEKIIGDKSTLQLAVGRLFPEFGFEDIYIATQSAYLTTVQKQLPFLPKENVIGEPEKKDVGPAVALMMALIKKKYPDEPVVILWSDHLVKNEKLFKKIIKNAGELVVREKEKIVFIGQKPRFASENLGWIEFGEVRQRIGGIDFHAFKMFKYRPDMQTAKEFFRSNTHCWNLGYFISTPRFIFEQFSRFAPHIAKCAQKIVENDDVLLQTLRKEYHHMPEISFDNAILEQLDERCAYVIQEDLGWSDVGAWEALKNALQKNTADNITHGNVLLENSIDSLVYNFQGKKLVVGIDLNEHIIINTSDVLLVTKKTSASKVKKLVEKLDKSGNSHLV